MFKYDKKEAIQSLIKSNFFLFNDCLVKQDEKENAVAHFKLDDIENITSTKKVSSLAVFFFLISILFTSLAYFIVQSEMWTIINYVLGGLSFSIFLLSFIENVLVLTVAGETIKYEIREDASELKGFVVSVRQFKNSYKKHENKVVYRNL